MKAIILAAGRGSRLNSLTEDKPKCMVYLHGKPLLHWQTVALHSAGVHEIAIVTGYKHEKVDMEGITHTFHNTNWFCSNMVSSLLCADEWLKQSDCIISYSDIFYEDSAVTSLFDSHADIAMTYLVHFLELWSQRFDDPLSDLETFCINDEGYLTEIGNRTRNMSEIQGQYMGLLKTTPKGWCDMMDCLQKMTSKDRDQSDMTSLLQLLIQQQIDVKTVPYLGLWGEVDTERDCALYEAMPLKSLSALSGRFKNKSDNAQ